LNRGATGTGGGGRWALASRKIEVEALLMSIKDRVHELILKNLDVDPQGVVPEAKFIDDLGVSSMDLWELVLVMEDEFDIEVPDEDLEKIVTVQDAIDFIESLVGKG
jgi:acyl carrier protein